MKPPQATIAYLHTRPRRFSPNTLFLSAMLAYKDLIKKYHTNTSLDGYVLHSLIADSSSYAQNKRFLEYTGMLAAVASIQIRNTDHQNVSRPKMSWLHSFGLIRDGS